jgi:hypothetical protein
MHRSHDKENSYCCVDYRLIFISESDDCPNGCVIGREALLYVWILTVNFILDFAVVVVVVVIVNVFLGFLVVFFPFESHLLNFF